MPESNQRISIPHFAWFHPGTYVAVARSTGFNVFQGTQTNPEGITATLITPMIPVNEAANNLNHESEPAKPTKKPNMSKISSHDSTLKEPKPKQSKKRSSNPKKAKGSGSSSAKPERNDLIFASYESNADASGIPAPVCTCTGVARQCYRGGAGAWQSSCCNYPHFRVSPPNEYQKAGFTRGRKENEPWSLCQASSETCC